MGRRIYQYQPRCQRRGVLRECRGRNPAAMRCGHDHRPGPHLPQYGAQIFDIGIEIISAVGRPVAFTMPAQVDIDDMASGLFQPDRYIFPDLARLAKAVKQDDRGVVGCSNIVRFKPDASEAFEFAYISHHDTCLSVISVQRWT